MKKILVSVIIIGAVISMVLYLFVKFSSQSIVPSENQFATSPTVSIWVPVNIFADVTPIQGKFFTNSSTGTTISFGEKIKFDDETANGYVDLLKNNVLIGRASSVLQALLSFSPNGKYFGFRTQYGYGATAFGHILNIINLTSGTVTNINAPYKTGREYPKSRINLRVGDVANLYGDIESYSWHEDAVDVVFYFVTSEYNESANQLTYYRATPKELWRYDLNTKSYTFIKTLPEGEERNGT